MNITSEGLNNIINYGLKLAIATNGFKTTFDALDVKFETGYLQIFIKFRIEDVKYIVNNCPDLKPLLYAIQDNDSSSATSDDYMKLLIKEGQMLNRVPEHIKKDINWLILMSCYLSLEEDTRDTAVKMLDEILEILVDDGVMNTASMWLLTSALWISDYPSYREEVLSRYNAGESAVRESYVNSQSSNTSSSGYNNGGGGCYVATAVYGSYDCPEVWTLRRFRDLYLSKSWYGRAFISIYYAVSPTLVKFFGETGWFKQFWKNRLDKWVASLKRKGYSDRPYHDCL